MKKNSSLAVSILLTSILLTACNTTETTTSNNEESEQTTTETTANDTTNETNADEANNEESTDDTSTENAESTDSSATDNESSQNTTSVDYTFDGTQFSAKTTPTTSEQLGYTIDLAEGFTLTSEEPGSDIIFYTDDSNYSMRVEYYEDADHNYDDLVATQEDYMAASSNNNYETVNIEQNAYEISKGTQFISVDESSNLHTIGAVFEKNGKIIVLTIFDGPDNSLKNAFLQMAYTIQ